MAALHGSGVELFGSRAPSSSGVSEVSAAYSEDDRDKKLQSASLEASEVAAGIADASSKSISSSVVKDDGESVSKDKEDESVAPHRDDSIVVSDHDSSNAELSESVLSALSRSMTAESSGDASGILSDTSSAVKHSVLEASRSISKGGKHVPKGLNDSSSSVEEQLKGDKVQLKGGIIIVNENDDDLFEQRLHFLRNNPDVAPAIVSQPNFRQRKVGLEDLRKKGFQTLNYKKVENDTSIREIVNRGPADCTAFLNALAASFAKLDGNYQDMLVPTNYAVRRNPDGTYDVKFYELGKSLGRIGTRADNAVVMMSNFLGFFCSKGENGGKKLLGGKGSPWFTRYYNVF